MILNVPKEILSKTNIRNVVQNVCNEVNKDYNFDYGMFRLGEVGDWEVISSSQVEGKIVHLDDKAQNLASFFFIVVEMDHQIVGFTSFHLAYSTWDGRVLFQSKTQSLSDSMEKALLFTLAHVAVKLEAQRLVWQHHPDKIPLYETLGASLLGSWLTLRMDPESINTFLLRQNIPIEISGNKDLHPMQSSIDEVLKNWPANDDVDVLLATNLEHLNHVERLVHALAVYEKEEDAVHIKKEHFFVDGGFVDGNQPLYNCLLLRSKSKDAYFGLALFYFGFDVERGQYLYLEDLYIDEAFRGKGSGTLIMTTLALIAKKTLCTGFVWQALDWNTLALTFYDNLGATVIDNLLTSRLCGEQIQEFLQSNPLGNGP